MPKKNSGPKAKPDKPAKAKSQAEPVQTTISDYYVTMSGTSMATSLNLFFKRRVQNLIENRLFALLLSITFFLSIFPSFPILAAGYPYISSVTVSYPTIYQGSSTSVTAKVQNPNAYSYLTKIVMKRKDEKGNVYTFYDQTINISANTYYNAIGTITTSTSTNGGKWQVIVEIYDAANPISPIQTNSTEKYYVILNLKNVSTSTAGDPTYDAYGDHHQHTSTWCGPTAEYVTIKYKGKVIYQNADDYQAKISQRVGTNQVAIKSDINTRYSLSFVRYDAVNLSNQDPSNPAVGSIGTSTALSSKVADNVKNQYPLIALIRCSTSTSSDDLPGWTGTRGTDGHFLAISGYDSSYIYYNEAYFKELGLGTTLDTNKQKGVISNFYQAMVNRHNYSPGWDGILCRY
ncbi:C39 family peptidase [Thermincola potens]|uniref:C39 family peptidase n=1 Tax=Thermincola potens TaxID=863643 RepID=UPI00059F207E|nr:C39 family peptidase [Thermincola potens]